jgi:hypothetical protein
MADLRRQVMISLPNLSNLSDDDLQREFSVRDGIWSDVTKRAKGEFGTDLVELDGNWAYPALIR